MRSEKIPRYKIETNSKSQAPASICSEIQQSRERLDLPAKRRQVPAVEDDEGRRELDNSTISRDFSQSFLPNLCSAPSPSNLPF